MEAQLYTFPELVYVTKKENGNYFHFHFEEKLKACTYTYISSKVTELI